MCGTEIILHSVMGDHKSGTENIYKRLKQPMNYQYHPILQTVRTVRYTDICSEHVLIWQIILMSKFRINSSFFSNILAVGDKGITNCMCKINLNNQKDIEIPLLVAISAFSSIHQELMADITLREFNINVDFPYKVDNTFYDKLVDILNDREVEITEQETLILAALGEVTNNREFIVPFEEQMQKLSNSLSLNNCFELVEKKHKFHFDISKFDQEIALIAENFETQQQKLHDIAKDVSYLSFITEILKSSKLLIKNEDILLDFVLSLCAIDNNYEVLLEYVYLEYCSVDKIKAFIGYLENTIETTHNIRPIFNCIKRRLVEPKIPKDQKYPRNSLKTQIINYVSVDDSDPYNGILFREHKKGNVIMKESTHCCGSPYNLLKGNSHNDYDTDSKQNSWIEASLKQDKAFIITKYMIRGSNNRFLNTWKLEGKRRSDNQWIILDQHSNDQISQYQLRVFPVNCDEILTAVKLTQTGPSNDNQGCGEYHLRISSFDIFGKYEC